MSIAALLYRRSLIATKNNLQFQMMQNSSRQRNMLDNIQFMGNLEQAHNIGTALALENIDNSSQLMAINAELSALDSSKINYFA